MLPLLTQGRLPFADWIDKHIRPEMIALASRDIWTTCEAITAGIGMGFMGNHEAALRGKLRAVLPHNPSWSVHGWIVTHVDLHRTEKIQAMMNCLKSDRLASRTAKQ